MWNDLKPVFLAFGVLVLFTALIVALTRTRPAKHCALWGEETMTMTYCGDGCFYWVPERSCLVWVEDKKK